MHKLTNFKHQYLLIYSKLLFLVEKKFLGFLYSLQSFVFHNFATSTAENRNGHFWTISNEFRVFLVLKALMKNFLGTICT